MVEEVQEKQKIENIVNPLLEQIESLNMEIYKSSEGE